MKRSVGLILLALLLFVLFVAFNLGASWLGGRYIWDATSSKRYTLTDDTLSLISKLPQPINLQLYVSDNIASYDWDTGVYAADVADILGRYRLAGGKKIDVEIRWIDADSDMEKQAIKDGMQPFSLEDEDFYFGIKITTTDGQSTIMPRLLASRRHFLESDINRVLRNFSIKKLPTVGIASPKIPLLEGSTKEKNWAIIPQLAQNYDLRTVPSDSSYIPRGIDVLIVVYPDRASPMFWYALDQYVVRGGKLILFVDPYSEIQHFYQGYPPLPDNDVSLFLKEWGIVFDNQILVGDISRSEKIGQNADGSGKLEAYPLWFSASGSGFENLHFRTSGRLDIEKLEDVDYRVLAALEKSGGEIGVSEVRYAPRSHVINAYNQNNHEQILAILAEGRFRSHYRNGIADNTPSEAKIPPYIPFSTATAAIAVVADSDFIGDDAWIESFDASNPVYGTQTNADNAEFVLGLVDYLSEIPVLPAVKQTKASGSIAQVLYSKVLSQHASALEKIQMQASASEKRLTLLRRKTAGSENIEYRRELDAAEKQEKADTKELKHLNFQIAAETDAKLDKFIWLNLIVLPLLIIAAICLLVWLERTLNRIWFMLHKDIK